MKRWEATAREHLRAILTRALDTVTPQGVMRERAWVEDGVLHLANGTRIDFANYADARLAAVGKAAAGMAAQAEAWTEWQDAVVVTNDAPHQGMIGFDVLESDHPVLTERSVKAGERVLHVAEETGEDDVMILLLSGGGSALAEVPAVPLEDLQRTFQLLLRVAAPIHEVNAVRKHLSAFKGGRLAQACKGRLIVLSISDVAGDDVSTIASGPGAADKTTFADAVDVLRKHGLWEQVPGTVREHLQKGVDGSIPETAKPGTEDLRKVTNHVLAGNDLAVDAAADAARDAGFTPLVIREGLTGEARTVGAGLAELAREIIRGDGRVQPPCAIIAGGETVVNVRGDGKGGRNQESVLAAVETISGQPVVFASFGTDGIDGPTDAAGAVADGFTLARAQKAGVDVHEHLENNDAYRFFEPLNDLIKTGPSGTNVRDVAVVLVGTGGSA